MKQTIFLNLLICGVFVLTITSCCEEPEPTPVTETLMGTGWNSQENFSQTIPVAINYSNHQSGGSLPASVDLTSKFPPIGNQGQLGTCVAWAVGYNTKSYLDGVVKNYSQAQLQSYNNQYSPTDLFFSINPSKRSCSDGTVFDEAFNVLINRGVNTLTNVPYDEQCRPYSPGSSATASPNRIKNFRRIDGSVNEIKQYLAQGIPVVIGAMVNKDFQMLKGNGVLTNLDYSGARGGHAMVIAGYNDSKGAFRIINSWGNWWGDNGYAWIGYDFLVNKFCIQGGQRSLFVAFNDNTKAVDPPPSTGGGPDLTALVMSDYATYPTASPYRTARKAFFDIKNIGNQTIEASSNWNIYYLWVDAFNANNYGVIFRGEFTTAIPQNTYQNVNSNYARINYNLASGASLGQIISGQPAVTWDYFMPALTGNYYLVLFIDKGNSNETNQTNNVFYVTQIPKYFANGYSSKRADNSLPENKYQFQNMLSFKHHLTESDANQEEKVLPFRSLSNKEFPNAYTSEEIIFFLKEKIKNGKL
ncbi:MAG: C1 family peptidase [Bacteroidota bacterium]